MQHHLWGDVVGDHGVRICLQTVQHLGRVALGKPGGLERGIHGDARRHRLLCGLPCRLAARDVGLSPRLAKNAHLLVDGRSIALELREWRVAMVWPALHDGTASRSFAARAGFHYVCNGRPLTIGGQHFVPLTACDRAAAADGAFA